MVVSSEDNLFYIAGLFTPIHRGYTHLIFIFVCDGQNHGCFTTFYFFLPPAALVSAIAARAARVTTTVATGTDFAFKISIPGT